MIQEILKNTAVNDSKTKQQLVDLAPLLDQMLRITFCIASNTADQEEHESIQVLKKEIELILDPKTTEIKKVLANTLSLMEKNLLMN